MFVWVDILFVLCRSMFVLGWCFVRFMVVLGPFYVGVSFVSRSSFHVRFTLVQRTSPFLSHSIPPSERRVSVFFSAHGWEVLHDFNPMPPRNVLMSPHLHVSFVMPQVSRVFPEIS